MSGGWFNNVLSTVQYTVAEQMASVGELTLGASKEKIEERPPRPTKQAINVTEAEEGKGSDNDDKDESLGRDSHVVIRRESMALLEDYEPTEGSEIQLNDKEEKEVANLDLTPEAKEMREKVLQEERAKREKEEKEMKQRREEQGTFFSSLYGTWKTSNANTNATLSSFYDQVTSSMQSIVPVKQEAGGTTGEAKGEMKGKGEDKGVLLSLFGTVADRVSSTIDQFSETISEQDVPEELKNKKDVLPWTISDPALKEKEEVLKTQILNLR